MLGWKVNIQPGPFKELLQHESDPKTTGLFRAAWSADYPTSWDFLEPLLGTQPADNPGDNRGFYSNPQFDKLLADGQAEKDASKRADDYKQAEKIAIGDDLALIPLWYRTQYRAFRQQVRGREPGLLREPDTAHHRAQVGTAASAGSAVKAGPADAVTQDCSGVA